MIPLSTLPNLQNPQSLQKKQPQNPKKGQQNLQKALQNPLKAKKQPQSPRRGETQQRNPPRETPLPQNHQRVVQKLQRSHQRVGEIWYKSLAKVCYLLQMLQLYTIRGYSLHIFKNCKCYFTISGNITIFIFSVQDIFGRMDDRQGCSDVQSSSWCGQLKSLCECTCKEPSCTGTTCPTTAPPPTGNLEYAICS